MLGFTVDLKIALGAGGLMLAIAGFAYKLYRDGFALQEKNVALLEENSKLKAQLQGVDDHRQVLADLTLDGNVYRKEGIPYCVACANDRGKLIPVIHRGGQSTAGSCPSCKTDYRNVFGNDPPPATPVVTRPPKWKPGDYV